MAENIKLKDLYGAEQTYNGIDTVKIPKADGSGDATFVVPPTSMYMLKESSYSGTEKSHIYAYSGVESDITVFSNNVQKELYPNALPIPLVHNYTFGENNIYCHPLEGMTITELMNRMLRIFSDDNVTVTPNTYSVTPGWFHIKYTKTGEGANIQVNITEFEEVADPSTITFPAYLPWTINDANYFYSYIAEATQQVKAVTVIENGTQTINPDAGKSGLAAVKLTVNVSTAPVGAYYLLKDPLGDMPAYEGGFVRYDNGSGVGGSDFKPFLAVVGNLNANSSAGYVNTSAFSYRAKKEEGFTSLIFIWYAAAAETMSAMVLQQFTGAWPFGDVALAKGWNITTFSESDGNVSANTVATTIDGVNEQLSSYGGIPENNFDDWSAIDSYTLSFFKKFDLFSLQQEKSVAVYANGNVEILPDAGYDAICKVNVAVDVPTGGGGGAAGGVSFIDYDGTVVETWALSDLASKTELPTPPAHDRLVFQQWNWTLEDIKAANADMAVGALYTTASGLTEFHIRVTKASGLTITCNMVGNKNWGDGTEDALTSHTYADYGDYIITCDGSDLSASNITASDVAVKQAFLHIFFSNKIKNISCSFYQCNALQTISVPKGVTNIRAGAFGECGSLRFFSIPNGIKIINHDTFSKCRLFQYVSLPNGITSMDTDVFNGCYSLRSVFIPSSVTSCGERTFASCRHLSSCVMPNGNMFLDKYMFYYCYSLQEVVLPNVKQIPEGLFSNCSSLRNIVIPNTVTTIGNYAFSACNCLSSVTIPNSVTSIGDSAFANCNVSEYDFSQFSKVPTLGTDVFRGILSSTKILVPSALYDTWVAATNWATYANNIVAV